MIVVTLALLGAVGLFVVRASPALARRVWLFTFTIILGGTVTMMAAHSFVAKWAFKGDSPRDGLPSLMDGTAYRPFVYRRLAPDIVKVTTDYLLAHLPRNAIDYFREGSVLSRYRWTWDGVEAWTDRKAIAFHVAYFMTWVAFFGTFLAGASLCSAVRRCSWFESMVTAALVLSLLPLMFVGGGYVYDAPELFLWTTLLGCVVRKWLWVVPPIFALMLLNKESALLAVPALFPILIRRSNFITAATWTAFLGLLGCLWMVFVRAKYAALPGEPMNWWLPLNLEFWSKPKNYLLFSALAAPGLPSPRGANILSLVFVLVPIRFGWRSIDRGLAWATVVMAAELLPLLLVSCRIDELRNLSLLYPLLAVVVVEGIHVMLGLGAVNQKPMDA